ncbi:MAG: hypothetical protein VYC31_09115, partial [Pseudomonadota bacterium]|nr:hypothetical protein [Pseudomonadota bacterium]
AAPALGDDTIDYIWASDALTGEIVSGRRFTRKEPPRLVIAVDRGGMAVFEPFLTGRIWAGLTSASDPKNTLLRALGGRGLPTTYLIDAEGRVLGHVEGDAAWDGAEARALIDYYLAAAGG